MSVMPKGVYKKIYSGEVQCTTTDTNIVNIASITVDGSYTDRKIIYARIRDKAGKRSGYYYGNDCFCVKGTTFGNCVYSYNGTAIDAYAITQGVYLRLISTNGTVTIASRYSATYSKTIDGTYTIELYALDWPDDSSPFTE